MKDKKRGLYFLKISLFLLAMGIIYYLVWNLEQIGKNRKIKFHSIIELLKSPSISRMMFIVFVLSVIVVTLLFIYYSTKSFGNKTEIIAGKIKVPKRQENNTEYGSARFATDKEQESLYAHMEIDRNSPAVKALIEEAKAKNYNLKERAAYARSWEDRYDRLSKEMEEGNIEERRRELEQEKARKIEEWEKEDKKRYEKEKEVHEANRKLINDWLKQYRKEETGGMIIHFQKKGSTERVQMMNEDKHTLIIGTSRSGKGRNFLQQSIGHLATCGENIICSDPKGENFLHTKEYLELIGYNVLALDFREPKKSIHYNFLELVNDAVDKGNIPEAVSRCWDIVSQYVGEPKGEKIWTNGEASMISGAAMASIYDNRHGENRKYRNMTNVYNFIAKGAEKVMEDKTRLDIYEESIDYNHPSKLIFGIAKAGAEKTLASFVISALTTLNLFTNSLIYNMTKDTSFSLSDIVHKKTAIFIILPDEKQTYYGLSTLFMVTLYQYLIEQATKYGGRLPIRFNYIIDEFGNNPKIPIIDTMMTASAGRGIRLCPVIQDFAQLDKVYGKDIAKIIQNNCETWVYLKTDDEDTKERLSKRLGTYTILSPNKSENFDEFGRSKGRSSSASYMGRELLKTKEISEIDRPYFLFFHRGLPYVSYSPDLSEWVWNDIYGLGDRQHNRDVYLLRNFMRKEESGDIEMEVFHPIQTITKEMLAGNFLNEQKAMPVKKKARSKQEYYQEEN